MAPTAPSKRRSLRARATAASSSSKHDGTPTTPVSSKNSNAGTFSPASSLRPKKARRIARHTALVTRLSKTSLPNSASSSSGISKSRRRRPNKKLSANLSSLLDVLPDLVGDAGEGNEKGTGGGAQGQAGRLQTQLANKILKHKASIRMKPGALKKKEKIARWEMRAFNRNLAASFHSQQIAVSSNIASSSAQPVSEETRGASPAASVASTLDTNHWAELRKRISSTMEQNPAFNKK